MAGASPEGLEAVATMCSESAPRTAALLAGAAERLRERISMRPHPPDASINRAYLDLARERLTAGAFDRRVARGPRDGAGVWGGSCPRSLPLG